MINILLSRGIINEPKAFIYLKNYILPKHRVLIIPWAFNKDESYNKYKQNGSYIKELMLKIMPYGIPSENIQTLDYEEDSYDIMAEKLKKQDIIYLPGGNPILFYERIREKGISDFIKKNANIVIGSSAGALIQFKQYHLTPYKDDTGESKVISYHQGLGLLDNFRIEVHFEDHKKKIKNLTKVYEEAPADIYVIYNDSFLIIDNGNIYPIWGSKKFEPNK